MCGIGAIVLFRVSKEPRSTGQRLYNAPTRGLRSIVHLRGLALERDNEVTGRITIYHPATWGSVEDEGT